MPKHQEWINERSYQYHLNCLQKIKSRKIQTSSNNKRCKKNSPSHETVNQSLQKQNRISEIQLINKTKQNSQLQTQDIFYQTENKQNEQSKIKIFQRNLNSNQQPQYSEQKYHFLSCRNPSNQTQNLFNKNIRSQNMHRTCSRDITNVTLKQQQLLWNNFLIGKRILQTSPVISKKKQDQEYQKHRELLKSRTTKKIQGNTNFRLRKLQQHNEKVYKIEDDQRLQIHLRKQYMVNLIIKSIEIFKYKFSSFQNIIVVMKHEKTQAQNINTVQKKTKQVSECIPSSMLVFHNFFFAFKKRYFEENQPIIIELKNVKSLNVISIGTFSFQFNQQKDLIMKQANLFSFGKHIGTVKFDAHFGNKNEFLSKVD